MLAASAMLETPETTVLAVLEEMRERPAILATQETRAFRAGAVGEVVAVEAPARHRPVPVVTVARATRATRLAELPTGRAETAVLVETRARAGPVVRATLELRARPATLERPGLELPVETRVLPGMLERLGPMETLERLETPARPALPRTSGTLQLPFRAATVETAVLEAPVEMRAQRAMRGARAILATLGTTVQPATVEQLAALAARKETAGLPMVSVGMVERPLMETRVVRALQTLRELRPVRVALPVILPEARAVQAESAPSDLPGVAVAVAVELRPVGLAIPAMQARPVRMAMQVRMVPERLPETPVHRDLRVELAMPDLLPTARRTYRGIRLSP